MNCFYSDRIVGNAVRLSEEDAQHALKSLRLRDGANIVLVVNGQRYAALLEVRGREVWANQR
jgi:16S rRNA U1498 N3-methylase RsmE